MPDQEVSSVVDDLGLVNVSGYPVVEPSLCAGSERRGSLGRLGLETLDGVDVSLLLILGEGVPANVSTCKLKRNTVKLTIPFARGRCSSCKCFHAWPVSQQTPAHSHTQRQRGP